MLSRTFSLVAIIASLALVASEASFHFTDKRRALFPRRRSRRLAKEGTAPNNCWCGGARNSRGYTCPCYDVMEDDHAVGRDWRGHEHALKWDQSADEPESNAVGRDWRGHEHALNWDQSADEPESNAVGRDWRGHEHALNWDQSADEPESNAVGFGRVRYSPRIQCINNCYKSQKFCLQMIPGLASRPNDDYVRSKVGKCAGAKNLCVGQCDSYSSTTRRRLRNLRLRNLR